MSGWISADQVFDGQSLLADHAVLLRDGVVVDVQATRDIAATRHHKGLLSAGFFDIQVNGGGGVMLNSDPTVAGIKQIIAAHHWFGTTVLLPTVITDAPEVLEAAVDAALNAQDIAGFGGLHIEGPHIAPARRGTHAEHYIRPLDEVTMGVVRRLRDGGVAVLITVAVEAATVAQIAALVEMGAVVALGHSDAGAVETQAALKAGACCFTHLYNAMSPMLGREMGVTGTAINSDAYCSIIADGIHVDPTMIRLAMRARPVADRMIAVSDAMATVGGPDHFDLYDKRIGLQDGRLVNGDGALAGAHLSMLGALQNLVSYGVGLETALRMCCSNPFALMGMADAGIVGLDAGDVLALGPRLELGWL